MISTPLTIALVAADIGVALLLLGAIAYVALDERRTATKPAGAVFVFAAGFVVAWLVAILTLAHNGVFEVDRQTPFPPIIAFAIIAPIIGGSVLLALLPGYRARVGRIPLHWLVRVQVLRVVGGLFLIAYLQDDIPAQFALPAGIGDVLIGLSAPFVAHKLAKEGPRRARRAVLSWCALGMLDLVVAVSCGFLSAPSRIQQLALDNPNEAITSYPFVLIPTFAVPIAMLLHIYVVARLLAAPKTVATPVGEARLA